MSAETGISHFLNRDSEIIQMQIDGRTEEYAIIKIFPFTSERKAMSIVLKHPT